MSGRDESVRRLDKRGATLHRGDRDRRGTEIARYLERKRRARHFRMHVGGLDSTSNRHLRWPVKEVGVGDEIINRIVETEVVDAPLRSQTRAEIEAEHGKRSDTDKTGDSIIEADLKLFDPQTGGWELRGSRHFAALPRIGEWVEIEHDGTGFIAKIVMVAHSGEPRAFGGVSLYATIEGGTSDCLKTLTETLRPDLLR